MTKVQLPFTVAAALDEATMNRLAAAHEIYGILRISIEPGGQKLTVEYDATRLTPKDVEAVLAHAGVSIVRSAQN
jgi:allophanate hydrolase subunit 1